MTDSAIFPHEYLAHIDLAASCLGGKYFIVAIRTGQPPGMRLVWKFDIRHILGVFHQDILIQHFHFFQDHLPDAGARDNGSAVQCLHPVNIAFPVEWEANKGLFRFLQYGLGWPCSIHDVWIRSFGLKDKGLCVGGGRQAFAKGDGKQAKGGKNDA